MQTLENPQEVHSIASVLRRERYFQPRESCLLVRPLLHSNYREALDMIQEAGNVIIANKIPCNSYRQDGRLEYTTNSEKPGLIPNTVTMLTVQYNEQTKNLRVNDIFIWHDSEYEIADIDYVGVNLNNTSGTLSIQAKKKVGGSIE